MSSIEHLSFFFTQVSVSPGKSHILVYMIALSLFYFVPRRRESIYVLIFPLQLKQNKVMAIFFLDQSISLVLYSPCLLQFLFSILWLSSLCLLAFPYVLYIIYSQLLLHNKQPQNLSDLTPTHIYFSHSWVCWLAGLGFRQHIGFWSFPCASSFFLDWYVTLMVDAEMQNSKTNPERNPKTFPCNTRPTRHWLK